MGMDINETGNIGTKDETRGTGMNGGVSEMLWKQDGLEDGKGIVEEGGVEWTCWRSIEIISNIVATINTTTSDVIFLHFHKVSHKSQKNLAQIYYQWCS